MDGRFRLLTGRASWAVPGKYLRVYLAEHYSVDQSRRTAHQTSAIEGSLEKAA